MALLEAVVFPPAGQHHVPCRVLRGYGVAAPGEFEGVVIKRGVVVQEGDGGELPVPPPPDGGACCPWAGGAATSWAGPAPSTTSSARRPAAHQQPAVRRAPLRRRRGAAVAGAARRRSVAEDESHRQNHIAVERNRRRQMNDYLAALRALMPPSYSRRGDQASIVEGAIEFVKELEHRLQSLQARKRPAAAAGHGCERFPGFFMFPQYSTAAAAGNVDDDASSSGENNRPAARPGAVADVEATVSEGHATVKVLAPRRQQLLLRLLLGMQRRGLAALHLNAITTADQMVLYTFSVKMGEGWQLSSAGDVAATVHDIVAGMDGAEEQRAI